MLSKKQNFIWDEYFLIFLLTSICMIFISRFSPLFSSFTAQDINVYSDIGRAALHGKVLYKDVFDHKGPAFLLIYGIFDLLSDRNYVGEWILFFITTFLFNIGIFKLSSFYINNYLSVIVVAISTTFTYMESSYYISCGTPEELFLPIYIFIIYGLLLLTQNHLSLKAEKVFAFFLGFSFSFILFSKINLVVFPAIASLIVFCYFCKLKSRFPTFETLLWIIGFLSVCFPIMIYLVYNNDVRDFVDAYIFFNFSYASNGNENSLFFSLIDGLIVVFRTFFIHMLVFFGGLLIALKEKKFTLVEVISIIALFFLTIMSEITTGRVYYYSMFTFLPFVILGLILVVSFFANKEIHLKKSIIVTISVLITIIGVFLNKGILESRLFKKDEAGIQKVANSILADSKGDRNIIILQYAYSADGIYTLTGSYPELFYFYTPGDNTDNMNYVNEAQKKYLIDGIPSYCVCTSRLEEYDWHIEQINDDYILIDKVEHMNENSCPIYISLYKKK